VHLGHREIVREVVSRARKRNGRSVVITFDPHPKEVVTSSRGPVRLLSTLEERIELLGAMEVDLLFVVRFTFAFSRLTSKEFYQQYAVDGVGVSEVVVGYDHMFGRDRQAGIEELVRMGQLFAFSVYAVPPYSVDGQVVSSTRIRKALTEGEIDHANRLLGSPYALSGVVVPGDGRGKTIGYPTANIQPSSDRKVIPGRGVYLVDVRLRDRTYHGMLNIGLRPTMTDGKEETMEVHIFEFSDDIYGETITIAFLGKLREEQKFTSAQQLIEQLHRDKQESLRQIAERRARK
jgi:riboflavin kinase / FMN adenylyltransferase